MGTRAIVSFVAGMTDMRIGVTALLCGVSALVWNGLLLVAGMELGRNWLAVSVFLETYGEVVTSLVVLGLLYLFIRWLYARRSAK